jgi:hypothetical protein
VVTADQRLTPPAAVVYHEVTFLQLLPKLAAKTEKSETRNFNHLSLSYLEDETLALLLG